jgi:hypothetical protein
MNSFGNVFDLHASHSANHCVELADEGHTARRIRICWRTGRILSVPYAWLPLFDYDPQTGELHLATDQLRLIITGRGLQTLIEHFDSERVLTLAETDSEFDDGEHTIWISKITVATGNVPR